MSHRFRARLSSFLLLAAFAVVPAAAAPKLPVEAFAALPVVQQATLSPDGQKLALMVNNEGSTTILVQVLVGQAGKRTSIMSTDNREYSFGWLRWMGNDRLLVGTSFPAKRLYGNSAAGLTATNETRLLTAKVDGSQVSNPMKRSSFRGDWQPRIQDRIIDFEPDDGRHVLLSLSGQEEGGYSAVYSLDLEAGERRHVHASREKFGNWMVDRNHKVRVGVYRDEADIEIHACDPDGRNWRKLWGYKVLADDDVWPAGFGKDPNELYVFANHDGRRALFTVDLRDPGLKRTLKLAFPKHDASGSLEYSRKTGEAVGLRGVGFEGDAEVSYWDKDRRELLNFIDQALPNRFNRIVSMSADETRYLVHSSNSQNAGEIYLGDDRANTMGLFALSRPGLAATGMVPKQAVTIKARDGLELPAYLSLPQGVEPKNLPLVMLVHGGPQSHDTAGFDAWAQFLANRGYAVLQVNFRGSTGFGTGLMAAGLRRWGLETQDDLTDAAQWAIARGTADPKRLCIVGGSFGGYAALMGVAKTPDLYRCAVSFAGVSDLVEIGRDSRRAGGKAFFEAQVGSFEREEDRLKATSPRYLAAQIKAPVLLMHGTEDRSVPIEQSEFMDAALSAAGKAHRFVKQERGDHHLSLYQHSVEFFKELEGFLAQHLGPGSVAAQ